MHTTDRSVFVKGQITRTLILDPTTKRFPLVVSHGRSDCYELPGGKVRSGEPLHAAALREVFEETGITPQNVRFIGTHQNSLPHDRTIVWRGHLFFGLHPETALILPPKEIKAARYASLAEARALPLEYFTHKLIERITPPRRP